LIIAAADLITGVRAMRIWSMACLTKHTVPLINLSIVQLLTNFSTFIHNNY